MPRAIPILIIIGLAVYSFFDVLQTSDDRIRRFPKRAWLVLVLVPVLGAALWFGLGRPRRSSYGPPRVITLKNGNPRNVAPDDDPTFLRRLDEEAWRRKREEQRRRAAESSDDNPRRRNDGPTPGPGIAPAG